MSDKLVLRARDFWASLVLIAISLFFLFKTTDIPFLVSDNESVRGGDWYNSAALVPYGLFGALLLLSFVLLFISIRDGGAKYALASKGLNVDRFEALRLISLSSMLFFYIFALVPRVDFTIASALLFCTLVYGFHRSTPLRSIIAASFVAAAGAYALLVHFPRNEWGKPHDDDYVTLLFWAVSCVFLLITAHRERKKIKSTLILIALSMSVPLLLVCSMAFGFRQNVPNRGGLFFSYIEYFYYVNVVPLWRA